MGRTCRELYRKYEEIINYLIVGVLTTAVSLGIYYGSVWTFLDPRDPFQLQAANVLSWVGAVAFAYVANRRYVFHSRSRSRILEAGRFALSRAATLLMDMAIMYLLVTLAGGSDKIAKLVSQAAVMVGNYVFSKLFVFRRSR